jgi:hypothetical protein
MRGIRPVTIQARGPDFPAVTTDPAGTARKKGGIVDMGAYERE